MIDKGGVGGEEVLADGELDFRRFYTDGMTYNIYISVLDANVFTS